MKANVKAIERHSGREAKKDRTGRGQKARASVHAH